MSVKRFNVQLNVLDAARKRMEYIFDEFEHIIVSISGGKDSTVLAHLALEEAHKRGRRIGLFYLDEEVVYKATIDQVSYLMDLYPENTMRYWLQIPFNLTNSVDIGDGQLHCWESSQRKNWMHKRSSSNILNPPWTHETTVRDKRKGFGFYDVMDNFEAGFDRCAHLVGLRADESLNRYRAMVKNPGYKEIFWSTARTKGSVNFYPLYDWAFNDIWKYMDTYKVRHHAYYDFAFLKGTPVNAMRVSSLIHEKSFKAIQELPEFEPQTYEKLLARCKGISFAQETAKDKKVFKCQTLPKNYTKWVEYRDFLLKTFSVDAHKEVFEKRFSKHLNNEFVARQQCRQLILNDYENNLPVKNTEDPVIEKVNQWMKIL